MNIDTMQPSMTNSASSEPMAYARNVAEQVFADAWDKTETLQNPKKLKAWLKRLTKTTSNTETAAQRQTSLWEVLQQVGNTYSHKRCGQTTQIDEYLDQSEHPIELQLRIENLLLIRRILTEYCARTANTEATLAGPEPTLSDKEQHFVERFEQVIEDNYHDSDFSANACAAALNVSVRQLSRKLSQLTGEKFIERLRDHRLEKSLELFASGMHINQIGDTVGFSSQSYFGSCFRTRFGKTPSSYQREVLLRRPVQ